MKSCNRDSTFFSMCDSIKPLFSVPTVGPESIYQTVLSKQLGAHTYILIHNVTEVMPLQLLDDLDYYSSDTTDFHHESLCNRRVNGTNLKLCAHMLCVLAI